MDAVGGLKRIAEDQQPGISGAKKPKMSDDTQPSRVLHVRSLPPSATEFGVAALASPFGRVTNIMMLRQRNQALMELEDEAAAASCCNYYKLNPAMINGHHVQIQHSRHSELVLTPNASGDLSVSSLGVRAGDGDGPNVLHVMIDNMIYPVTLDVLHTIFSKYGTVLRIVTFNKNGQYQALVELADCQAASAAKLALDGQNIYDRCCTMRIDSSKLAALTVNGNNDRQRDYTKPDSSESVSSVRPGMSLASPTPASMHGGLTSLASSIPGLAGLPPATVSALQNLMAASGNGSAAALHGFNPSAGLSAFQSQADSSPVLLASNLNAEVIMPNDLFILFGVYGDVLRVKILFNKKDTALVQFTSSTQAQAAQKYLHRVMFFNKPMHVTTSKHHTVAMPKEDQDLTLTKDYTDSPLHRYKQVGSHNLQNIFPPSPSLHLSSIPMEVTQDQLEELFKQSSPTIVTFKWLPHGRADEEPKMDHRRMALIQLPSTELAVQTLVATHNHKFYDKRYLKVSFAKNAVVQ